MPCTNLSDDPYHILLFNALSKDKKIRCIETFSLKIIKIYEVIELRFNRLKLLSVVLLKQVYCLSILLNMIEDNEHKKLIKVKLKHLICPV